MTNEDILGAVAVLNPGALARAQRVVLAVSLLRSGSSRADVVGVLRARHQVGRSEAWQCVSMAADMALPLPIARQPIAAQAVVP